MTTTITDDDDAPTGITLSASPSSLGEDDSATNVTVTATLNGSKLPSDTLVTIGTLAGSATKDTDYTVTTLVSINIPANSSSGMGTLTITPTDDAVVEGDETITIPGTTSVNLSVTSATVTLTDDDKSTTTPTDDKDSAELSIYGPASNVSEGGNATFTVTLSAAVAAQVQVAWSAPLGTDAAEGADLSATSGNGDICGEQRGWGDAGHHDNRYRRQAVGGCGVVYGDSGNDHVDAELTGLVEERGEGGDGDNH